MNQIHVLLQKVVTEDHGFSLDSRTDLENCDLAFLDVGHIVSTHGTLLEICFGTCLALLTGINWACSV